MNVEEIASFGRKQHRTAQVPALQFRGLKMWSLQCPSGFIVLRERPAWALGHPHLFRFPGRLEQGPYQGEDLGFQKLICALSQDVRPLMPWAVMNSGAPGGMWGGTGSLRETWGLAFLRGSSKTIVGKGREKIAYSVTCLCSGRWLVCVREGAGMLRMSGTGNGLWNTFEQLGKGKWGSGEKSHVAVGTLHRSLTVWPWANGLPLISYLPHGEWEEYANI